MRAIFFGMECHFSEPPLTALLAATDVEVAAVVLPRPRTVTSSTTPIRLLAPPLPRHRQLPLYHASSGRDIDNAPNGRGVVEMTRAAGVPVYEAGRLADERTLTTLSDLRPDLIVVACFPRLLPSALLRLPRHGGLNVHPSLLPEYRGPFPLFWVFHDGLEHAGVTVHAMDSGADTGDIVRQTPLSWPDGISYAEAERRCAEEGARLLTEALYAIAADKLLRRSQLHRDVPTAPVPTDADFVITPDWPARRAFNFIRGMGGWGHPITLSVGDDRFIIREAVSFNEDATLGEPVQRLDGYLRIRCTPGVLTVTARSTAPRP